MTSKIYIEDYNYNLPNERIAKYPLSERSDSKLLLWNKGNISEEKFKNITDYFQKGDLLISNNTKVIQARLHFFKDTGAKIEIFCLEPHSPADYEQNFQSTESCRWKCIVGNSKKWKTGKLTSQVKTESADFKLFAERISTDGNSAIIEFTWANPTFSFSDILEKDGQTPIPPYLNRKAEQSDTLRYQTVYSRHKGSVAAPTAGLHFNNKILKELENKGVKQNYLSLHVGAGTFKPVKTEDAREHEMHNEHFFVSIDLLKDLIAHEGKITAVGTTSVRSLESLYYIGQKLKFNSKNPFHITQWEAYETEHQLTVRESLTTIIDYLKNADKEKLEASTQIMIAPGFEFKIVNRLITNFHQPKSTLLLLISSFTGGENWKNIYDFALKNDFRFLSYGDSSLLIR